MVTNITLDSHSSAQPTEMSIVWRQSYLTSGRSSHSGIRDTHASQRQAQREPGGRCRPRPPTSFPGPIDFGGEHAGGNSIRRTGCLDAAWIVKMNRYEGKRSPNMGRPLTDSACVASSCNTSQCSARKPSSNRTMSAAIQAAGLPFAENRPCAMT
jgi:hypothetical protein